MNNFTSNEIITLIISISSFIFSGLIFWYTSIKKGKLKMTKPTLICLLGENNGDEPKIFIRTLLYATSERGQYIENMFIRFKSSKTVQNFNVWAYGEDKIIRGSGIFIDKNGFANYHHFLLPKNEKFTFSSGEFTLEVFAETVNKKSKKLFEQKLSLTEIQTNELQNGSAIYYNWTSNLEKYLTHTDNRKKINL